MLSMSLSVCPPLLLFVIDKHAQIRVLETQVKNQRQTLGALNTIETHPLLERSLAAYCDYVEDRDEQIEQLSADCGKYGRLVKALEIDNAALKLRNQKLETALAKEKEPQRHTKASKMDDKMAKILKENQALREKLNAMDAEKQKAIALPLSLAQYSPTCSPVALRMPWSLYTPQTCTPTPNNRKNSCEWFAFEKPSDTLRSIEEKGVLESIPHSPIEIYLQNSLERYSYDRLSGLRLAINSTPVTSPIKQNKPSQALAMSLGLSPIKTRASGDDEYDLLGCLAPKKTAKKAQSVAPETSVTAIAADAMCKLTPLPDVVDVDVDVEESEEIDVDCVLSPSVDTPSTVCTPSPWGSELQEQEEALLTFDIALNTNASIGKFNLLAFQIHRY